MITGRVRGQELKLSSPLVVSDTIDYLTVAFTFQTSDWDGTEKWSHWQNGGEVYDIKLDKEDRITEEQHLNLSDGTWKVWLHGVRYHDGVTTQRITTNETQITVKKSGALNGEPFPTVPPTAGEQIIAAAAYAADRAEKAASDAYLDAKSAANSKKSAETAAEKSVASSKSAASSASSAAKSADRAEQVAVANGYIEFELDNEDGILYLVRTDNIVDEIDFELNENTGELEVIIE